MNIAKILSRSGVIYNEQPAVFLADAKVHSYSELAQRCAIIAGKLINEYQLQAGDSVAIISGNCPEYVELCFAIWHSGLVVVPINAKLHVNEFHYILEHSRAKICFVSEKLSSVIKPLLKSINTFDDLMVINSSSYSTLCIGEPFPLCEKHDNDAAWLFYTSGTTGKPKGAMLSHQNLMAMTQCFFSDIDSVNVGDTIIHAAPMSHGSGFYILPYIANGGVNVIPASGGFKEQELHDLLQGHHQVSFFAAPTMVKRWVEFSQEKNSDYSQLKTIIYGGGPMYQKDLANAHQLLGYKLVQMYGMGECPMSICALSKYHHNNIHHCDYSIRLASVGIPMLGMEIKIVDEQGHTLKNNTPGEVLVRGRAVMLGYFNNEKATKETIIDGWLKTGDMAIRNEDGFISFIDRAKDLIISGGSNIYPREVEEILNKHESILEVSVVGKPNREWGEIVVAIVVVKENHYVDAELLDLFCIENMTRFKRPKKYIYIDALPKNNTGKILKNQLREMVANNF